MKKSLKLASAFLAGVLALGFAACSSGDDSSSSGNETEKENGKEQETDITTKGLMPVLSVAASSSSASVVLSWNDPADTANYSGVKILGGVFRMKALQSAREQILTL